MRRYIYIFLMAFIFSSQSLALGLESQPQGFSKLVEKVSPAVVNINTTRLVTTHPLQGVDPLFDDYLKRYYKNNPQAPGQKETNYGLGSGFIVSEDGKIITNYHVVRGSYDIYVSLESGEKIKAKILGFDEKIDIAILQLTQKGSYPFLEWGSSEETKVGDLAIAMGNPLGLGKTVTAGIISAKERNIQIGPYDNFIQTDASINPGNSGGPLFNVEGKVVGVNTAIIGHAQGIGFAIPIDTAKHVYEQIVTVGRVQRGWMGISLVELTPDEAKKKTGSTQFTTFVAEVVPRGPADLAGIKAGDIITQIDNKAVDSTSSVPRLVASQLPGQVLRVTVLRNGKTVETEVTLGDQDNPNKAYIYPITQPASKPDDLIGIDVRDIEATDNTSQTQGVFVSYVHPETVASAVGLNKGDVIVEINNQKVMNTKNFSKIMSTLKSGDLLSMKVYRNNSLMNFAIRK